jgi:FtsH-binding integral membrane protein
MQPQTSSFIIDVEVTMDALLSLFDDFWFWLGHWLSELLFVVWLSVSPQVHVIVGWRAFELEVVGVNRENGNKLMAFQHLCTQERGTWDGGIIDVQNIKVRLIILFWCALFSQMTLVGSVFVTVPCLKVCRDILSHI